MKKVLYTLLLSLVFSASFATQVIKESLVSENQVVVEKQIQFEPALDIATLIGVTENKLSEELMDKVAWSGIPNRPHFIFHTLQQCQSVPECVCEPYDGRWGCFIR